MIELDTIYNEDCLTGMQRIPDGSVDCIICDLPYGTTACKWDSVIPFEPLWEQYKRVTKPNAAIVLFGQEPFSSALRMSNIEWFRYDWIWDKGRGHNFAQANYCPMRSHEIISVFSDAPTIYSSDGRKCRYNPQMWDSGKPYTIKERERKNQVSMLRPNSPVAKICPAADNKGERYPLSILRFKGESKALHPTQKPVDLIAYLIRTYSNPGDTILDNTIGSGTTAVAALREKRHFIGFELNRDYYDIALRRIKLEQQQQTLF